MTSEYFYEDGDIRINSPNPLYLDNPYTLQSGGCGERGKYIYLTPGTVYTLEHDAELLQEGIFFLLHLFSRDVLVMKKLDIQKTKPIFIISVLKNKY